MSQVAIWNFYWTCIREKEDEIGADILIGQIDGDVPFLEGQLDSAKADYERVKAEYEALL